MLGVDSLFTWLQAFFFFFFVKSTLEPFLVRGRFTIYLIASFPFFLFLSSPPWEPFLVRGQFTIYLIASFPFFLFCQVHLGILPCRGSIHYLPDCKLSFFSFLSSPPWNPSLLGVDSTIYLIASFPFFSFLSSPPWNPSLLGVDSLFT